MTFAERDEELARLTHEGVSRREIAKRLGCCVATVAARRRALQISAPPRPAAGWKLQVKLTAVDHDRLAALAARFGTTIPGAIRRLIQLATETPQ